MSEPRLAKVKIVGNGMYCKVVVDDHQLRGITSIEVDFNSHPHILRLEMLAEIEIEDEAMLDNKIIGYFDNRKFELREIKEF